MHATKIWRIAISSCTHVECSYHANFYHRMLFHLPVWALFIAAFRRGIMYTLINPPCSGLCDCPASTNYVVSDKWGMYAHKTEHVILFVLFRKHYLHLWQRKRAIIEESHNCLHKVTSLQSSMESTYTRSVRSTILLFASKGAYKQLCLVFDDVAGIRVTWATTLCKPATSWDVE